MNIETEADVKPLAVQRLRNSLGLSQAVFWQAVGVTLQQGHRYENGLTKDIPRTARRLVFLHYVIGIPTNGDPAELRKMLANWQQPRDMSKHLQQAENALQAAKESLNANQPGSPASKGR